MNNNNIIRERAKRMLMEFASTEYQSKEWSMEKTWYFPSEFTARWFDDTFFGLDKLIEMGDLNKEEWRIIEPFHNFFSSHVKDICQDKFENDPALLLSYGLWHEIQIKAKETLDKLNQMGWDKIKIEW